MKRDELVEHTLGLITNFKNHLMDVGVSSVGIKAVVSKVKNEQTGNRSLRDFYKKLTELNPVLLEYIKVHGYHSDSVWKMLTVSGFDGAEMLHLNDVKNRLKRGWYKLPKLEKLK